MTTTRVSEFEQTYKISQYSEFGFGYGFGSGFGDGFGFEYGLGFGNGYGSGYENGFGIGSFNSKKDLIDDDDSCV